MLVKQPRPPGHPPLSQTSKTTTITVRVTEAELAKLNAECAKANLGQGRYICRELGLSE